MSDRRPVKADERTPIDAAIDEAERKRMEEELAKLDRRQAVRIPLLTERHTWTGDQEITIAAVPGDVPTLLLWDDQQGAFRAVVLPEGSTYRVVPDRSGLWTPGGRS
jgi:hypothetical protein